ncbi:MAG: AsmA family protein [Deltaproteobacteria bacterium]|nr:MAG: AsmA family protein [Deltaproteobacteria bacterium]
MSKIYKWLAAILGGLLLLFLALVLFVRFYLTGELIAAWIEPPMEHYLHRNVTLADARVGFRGFRVDGLEIQQQGSSAPLLKGEKLELRWKFKELLAGKIVIHTLVFTKPEITLVRHADGKLNIADLLPQNAGSNTEGHSSKYSKEERAGVPLLISLLSMENGYLTFVDRSQKPEAKLEIRNLKSRINDFSATAPIPFQIEGQIVGTGDGSLALKGKYNPVGKILDGDLSLKEVDLVRISPVIARGHSDIIQSGLLTLETSLSAEGFDHYIAKGSLNLVNLKVKSDEKLSETLQVEADFQLDALRSKETLKVNSLNMVLNGQSADIQGTLTQWQKEPLFDFTLSSPEIKLDELLALLPKAPPEPESTEVPTDQSAPAEDSSSTPKVEEKASSEVISAPLLTKTEEKSVEQLNAVENTPQSATSDGKGGEKSGEAVVLANEPASEGGAGDSKVNIPLGLDARGAVHVDWFHYNKFVASNVECQVNFQDGKLRVQPLSASLYGGTLGGNVSTETKSVGPPFHSILYTENILLDEIVGAIWPETGGHWSGNVNMFFKGSGSGSDLGALQSRIDLNINEVEFSGHPLFTKLAELFQAENLQQLRFSQVTARVLTKDGVANIKRLHLVGPIVQAEGTGTAGLLDSKLDLHLLLQIRAQYVGKIAPLREIVTKISDKHGFVQLPLTVRGTFDQPAYGLDQSWLEKIAKKVSAKPVEKPKKKKLPKQQPLNEQKQKQLQKDLEKLVQ